MLDDILIDIDLLGAFEDKMVKELSEAFDVPEDHIKPCALMYLYSEYRNFLDRAKNGESRE